MSGAANRAGLQRVLRACAPTARGGSGGAGGWVAGPGSAAFLGTRGSAPRETLRSAPFLLETPIWGDAKHLPLAP